MDLDQPRSNQGGGRKAWLVAVFLAMTVVLFVTVGVAQDPLLPVEATMETVLGTARRLQAEQPEKIVREPIAVYVVGKDHSIARKQFSDLVKVLPRDRFELKVISVKPSEQRAFIQEKKCGVDNDAAVERYDEFIQTDQEQLAEELWKFCALQVKPKGIRAVAFMDTDSPLTMHIQGLLSTTRGIAVLGDDRYFPNTVHSSLLYFTEDHMGIARNMVELLVETPFNVIDVNHLLFPKALYNLIETQIGAELQPGQNSNKWYLLKQQCTIDSFRRKENLSGWSDASQHRLIHQCPANSGFCCSVHDIANEKLAFMSRKPLMPSYRLPETHEGPYNAETGHYEEDELPYISIVSEDTFEKPEGMGLTYNFYDILVQNNCLPDSDSCSLCLRNKNGANCRSCRHECSCYCKSLCHEKLNPRHVAKHMIVYPPRYSRDPNRLIPKIVHQTWFEELTPDKYPNMSRLVESFRSSGWEYKFYSDDAASNFISTHFPVEVREAYDALLPGAFKADLFRYCVLLIHGGLYADVDIHLESRLDFSVAPDIGFMVPIDEPGRPVGKQMCMWNGLLAAAPGHPFLAKAIETVVNQVRNRFTSVDIDETFCPDPELSVTHAFDTLFTAGPCLLGSSINRVLGRSGQHSFTPGEIHPFEGEQLELTEKGTLFVQGAEANPKAKIPGRTMILKQNKVDMGAHRFTLLSQNIVLGATDMPGSNDREEIETTSTSQHYSKAHAKSGIYGLSGLYVDQKRAQEEIRIIIDASTIALKQ